jgi:hypothetical protein
LINETNYLKIVDISPFIQDDYPKLWFQYDQPNHLKLVEKNKKHDSFRYSHEILSAIHPTMIFLKSKKSQQISGRGLHPVHRRAEVHVARFTEGLRNSEGIWPKKSLKMMIWGTPMTYDK